MASRQTPADEHFRRITFGEQLASFQVSGFQFVETRHPGYSDLDRHAHADASVNFVLSGSLTETVGHLARRREFNCHPGSLLFKPANEYHSNVYGRIGARCLIVQPSADRLDSLERSGATINAVAYRKDADIAAILRRIYLEMKHHDDLSAMALEGHALVLFAMFAKSQPRKNGGRWATQVHDYLRAHSREKITLTEISAALQVDPATLSRRFREAYGLAPSEFVRKERTRWAAGQLTSGTAPLTEIAAGAGFVDQSHFTRVFKEHYGVTPARFRELTRYT